MLVLTMHKKNIQNIDGQPVKNNAQSLKFLPVASILNKSCNIECCGDEMHQTAANMMSQYSKLKLGLL